MWDDGKDSQSRDGSIRKDLVSSKLNQFEKDSVVRKDSISQEGSISRKDSVASEVNEFEEDSVVDTTVKSPSLMDRFLHSRRGGTDESSSVPEVNPSDSVSGRKRLSSEVDGEGDGDDGNVDGKRRKTNSDSNPLHSKPSSPSSSSSSKSEIPPKTPQQSGPRRKKLYAVREMSTPPDKLMSPTTGRDLSPSVVVGLNRGKKAGGKAGGSGGGGRSMEAPVNRRRSTRVLGSASQSSLKSDEDPVSTSKDTAFESGRSEARKSDNLGRVNVQSNDVEARRDPVQKSASDAAIVPRRKSRAKKAAFSDSDALLGFGVVGGEGGVAGSFLPTPSPLKSLESFVDAVSCVEKPDAQLNSPRIAKKVGRRSCRGLGVGATSESGEKTDSLASGSTIGISPTAENVESVEMTEASHKPTIKSQGKQPTKSKAARKQIAPSTSDSDAEGIMAPKSGSSGEKAAAASLGPVSGSLNPTSRNSLEDFDLKPRKKKVAEKKPNLASQKNNNNNNNRKPGASSKPPSSSKTPSSSKSGSCSSSSSSDERSSRSGAGKKKSKLPGLLMTSCHRNQQTEIKAALKTLPERFSLSSSVTEAVTHVVTGEARRTLNLLRGMDGMRMMLQLILMFVDFVVDVN